MLFSYRSGYSKIKFQSIDEKKVFAMGFMIRGFFFVFSGAIFGIRWVQILLLYQWIYFEKKIFRCFVGSDPLKEGMDLFWKELFVNNL